jgi:hypothetical protein
MIGIVVHMLGLLLFLAAFEDGLRRVDYHHEHEWDV